MKRILVTGSRDWEDVSRIFETLTAVMRYWKTTNIILVHGGARGADTIAGQWASSQFLMEEVHFAEWDLYGKKAGFVRNAEMVKSGADICVAFIKDNSRGATMCAELAEKAGIPTLRVMS